MHVVPSQQALAFDIGGDLGVHQERDDQSVQSYLAGNEKISPLPGRKKQELQLERERRGEREGGERLTQDFGEDEDKNHADEQSGLLRRATDTGITHDPDRKPAPAEKNRLFSQKWTSMGEGGGNNPPSRPKRERREKR